MACRHEDDTALLKEGGVSPLGVGALRAEGHRGAPRSDACTSGEGLGAASGRRQRVLTRLRGDEQREDAARASLSVGDGEAPALPRRRQVHRLVVDVAAQVQRRRAQPCCNHVHPRAQRERRVAPRVLATLDVLRPAARRRWSSRAHRGVMGAGGTRAYLNEAKAVLSDEQCLAHVWHRDRTRDRDVPKAASAARAAAPAAAAAARARRSAPERLAMAGRRHVRSSAV